MTDFKAHFDYINGGALKWEGHKSSHVYKLTPTLGTLKLAAAFNGIQTDSASTLDHFVWDELVQKKTSRWCDCLTLWTNDLEFNVLLFGKGKKPSKLQCAYFPVPDAATCRVHLAYWGATIASGRPLKRSVSGRKIAGVKEPLGHLIGAIQNASRAIRRRKPKQSIGDPINHRDGQWLKENLSSLVVWNRFSLRRRPANRSKRSESEPVEFNRNYTFAFDPFRRNLKTIPIPSDFLAGKGRPPLRLRTPSKAAERLYRAVLEHYANVSGCGSPMKRNLLALASLLADPSIKAALVTGEPGTGKENLCKALYYGNKVSMPKSHECEAIFFETTALAIQNAMRGSSPISPGTFLGDKLRSKIGSIKSKPKSPVVFIDELNKAEQDFLSAMLRPLEQGKRELQTDGDPKYILAASEHIDRLAKTPPQDFWTRISHQLRVAHPLSRVSDEDGEEFLESFFYSQWWQFIATLIDDHKRGSKDFVEAFLGHILPNGTLEPSPFCNRVRLEFLNALVPFVTRDTLSVRGARSILGQTFARLSWFIRFQTPLGQELDTDTEKQIARRVSSAVQDVLAILNAARATPAGLDDKQAKQKD